MSKNDKEKKMNNLPQEDIILDIPEDEIYTYQIEGLAAPHINKPYKHYTLKKIIFIAVIIIAVSLSMYFSLMILQSDTFTFAEIDAGNYQFSKFSNPGYIEELHINYVMDIVYPDKYDTTAEENSSEEATTEENTSAEEDTTTDIEESTSEEELTEEETTLSEEEKNYLSSKEEFLSYQAAQVKAENEKAALSAVPKPYFEIVEDKEKPVTHLKDYTFNCDGYLKVVYIGENVTQIDAKAFYSCWSLKAIFVDENNPNYCDVDGVLYNKDKTEVICYPCDHDQYLREKYNYPKELWQDVPLNENNESLVSEEIYNEIFEEYKTLVMTYTVPSTVSRIGELCFNYANLATVYLPENLKVIDNLAFFEMPNMKDFYTYKTEIAVENTDYASVKDLDYYISLPEGLEKIGTDAFSYNKAMTYVYIPESVKYIGHHAFWETCYLENGEIKGLDSINVATDKDTFKENTETGDQWIPIYNPNTLKSITVEYGSQRISD